MSDNRLALSVAVAAGEDYVKRAINSAEWRVSARWRSDINKITRRLAGGDE